MATKRFSYKTSIPACSQAEADRKMKALMALASGLSASELSAFAQVVKNDPGKVKLAKDFLGIS